MERRGARWSGRVGWALIVLITALEVLSMGSGGLSKFQSMDGWMYWFARFGYPPHMALVIGALEFAGAGLLLIPRIASYVAVGLSVIMLGALEAVLTTETDLGWFDPALHLAFLGIIGSFHWKRRWKWARATGDSTERRGG